ncbi:hypothetical protein [Streptomyces prunicolor]|uniref:hypothetical protein n=1 Tax=Streptomyces prunicolor TaxID=67348 RepID=UPI00037EEDA0|nr:hypothetical protein [Streptomyces prunicolor]
MAISLVYVWLRYFALAWSSLETGHTLTTSPDRTEQQTWIPHQWHQRSFVTRRRPGQEPLPPSWCPRVAGTLSASLPWAGVISQALSSGSSSMWRFQADTIVH